MSSHGLIESVRDWQKIGFAILWRVDVILAHLVKKAALLYIARPSRKSLREDDTGGLLIDGVA